MTRLRAGRLFGALLGLGLTPLAARAAVELAPRGERPAPVLFAVPSAPSIVSPTSLPAGEGALLPEAIVPEAIASPETRPEAPASASLQEAATQMSARPEESQDVSRAAAIATVVFDGGKDGGKFDGGDQGGDGGTGQPPQPPGKKGASPAAPARAYVHLYDEVLFPGVNHTIETGDKKSLQTFLGAMSLRGAQKGYVVVVTEAEDKAQATEHGHFRTASLARIVSKKTSGKGRLSIGLRIIREARIEGYEKDNQGRLLAKLSYPPEPAAEPEAERALVAQAHEILKRSYKDLEDEEEGDINPGAIDFILKQKDARITANLLSQELPLDMKVKQELLAAPSLRERLESALREMSAWEAKLWAQRELYSKMEKIHRAAVARKAMRNLQLEIGEADPSEAAGNESSLRERVEKSGMPAELKAEALLEVARMTQYDGDSRAKILDHLRWLLDLPWDRRSEDRIDIAEARRIMDRDHYGLTKIKDRILEYLAIRKLGGSLNGKILCFLGPKGTGKTSLAANVAEAMGRRLVSLRLGGVKDEAEIRGHRRTYVDSGPGSIIKQIKKAGTLNPVFLLDEIDKLGKEPGKGDPSSALLEVLDPTQNRAFRDHYLDADFPLDEVFFITTANRREDIPPELADRMEFIEFPGYTPDEKLPIAEHILRREAAAHALAPGQVAVSREALAHLIARYTREPGVRKLTERLKELLLKASAWRETKGEAVPAAVERGDVEKYLGPIVHLPDSVVANGVGIASSMSAGDYEGDTDNIEAFVVPGKGKLRLREEMEKSLRDSAHNVLVYVKSQARPLGIDPKVFADHDFHFSFAPARPVDGPSAGSVMATALVSRLTGRPVKRGVAMTGELTMTGRVLPIGGLRQKVLAAHRNGITTVLYPIDNRKDLADIPPEVRSAVELIPVRTAAEVFALALEPGPSARPPWWRRLLAALRILPLSPR